MYSLLKNYKREDYFICGKLPVYNVVTYRDFKEFYYIKNNNRHK